jgi:hypothetical protein
LGFIHEGDILMRILWFHLFSFFEWSVLISIAFAVFRFRVRDHIAFIVFTALFMSMFSYIIRDLLGLVVISPFIQLIVLILVFNFILRLSVIYAGIVVSFGYIIFVSLQFGIILMLHWLSFMPINESFLFEYDMLYIASIITILTGLLIIWVLKKYRIGFTFVAKEGLRRNLPFLILISLVALSFTVILLPTKAIHIQFSFIGMSIILVFLLHFLLKREKESI